jgi:molybdate transport system substrate-binding protein
VKKPAAFTTTIALGLLSLASIAAEAAEVRVLSAVGMREVLLDLGPKFERASGHTLAIKFDAGGVIVSRVQAGESVDVVMVPRAGLERLRQAGKIVAGSSTDLASSVAGVAVRQGAAKPDISSPEAFKRALLAARSVARPDPALGGSSGVHIAKVLERLGIASEIQAKSVIASRPDQQRDMPGAMVADGRAELALHQVQELMAVPGIEIVGPFPGDLQETFVFSGGVVTGAREVEAASSLIVFLRTPEAIAVIKAKGMAPAP